LNGDVEAIFFFLDNTKVYEGYRPAHLIKEDYLTTGVHHYYKNDADNEIKGTITFISPEYCTCQQILDTKTKKLFTFSSI